MNGNIKDSNNVHECTGCQVCAAICPVNAISIHENEEGFWEPVIDEKTCIQCGKCKKVCYKYDQHIKSTDEKKISSFAAKSKDKDILKSTTSGGVAYILAEELLKQNYRVVGVKYDKREKIAVDIVINKVDELNQIKGSKYMQSYTLDAFKEVIDNCKNLKYAVFGTPCHIYALSKWIEENGISRNNMIFIDIFCHGCPSMMLWKKYVKAYENKYCKKEFDKIIFRSKSYGWHEFAHDFIIDGKKNSSQKTIKDPFFQIFFQNNILARACYKCKVRSELAYTDIRLGDFWGERFDKDSEGVSAIAAYTKKGKQLIHDIKDKIKICPTDFCEIIKEQSYGKNYVFDMEKRETTFRLLKDFDIDMAYNEYIKKLSVKSKIIYKCKCLFALLPTRVRYSIKQIYHHNCRRS